MSHTDYRIANLEARLAKIDEDLAAFSGGVEEYRIGSVMERRSNQADLADERRQVEMDLSKLYSLKDFGGRTLSSRPR